MESNSKLYLLKGISSTLSAILQQFSLFPLFMMSNIIPFMISYLYHLEKDSSSDNTSSIRQRDGYFIHPFMSLFMSIFCFFGGIIGHFMGSRMVILLGGIFIALGDMLFVISQNLILDFFINIFFGIGFAISMTASVKNACKYFPKKRGLINALAGGFGGNLGSSTFNLVIKLFVSKGDYPRADDNNMYIKSTAENYKIFFYIHAGVAFGFGVLSCLLLIPYENNINEDKKKFAEMIEQANNIDRLPENVSEEINKSNKELEKRNYKEDLKFILSHYRIYYLLAIFLFTSFLQGFILTVGFNFGTMNHGENNNNKIGGDEMSIIFMLMSLVSCFIGPIFGSIYDKFGFKKTMIFLNIISVINGSLIFITVRLGVIYYGISIILNGCLNSGAFSMIFPYVSKIFGFNYAGELYGIVVLSVGISSIMSSSIYYIFSKVIKTENDISYLLIFIVGIIMNIISIVMTYYEKEDAFSFYRVNFLQEKRFLNDDKEKLDKHIKNTNDINYSDNEENVSDDMLELEEKNNINDSSETEG